jgi:hypothetical protein
MGQKISEKQMKEEIRSVVRENIKEVTTNDWHFKAIMSIWDKGGSFTRKKIASVLCGDPKADRRDVEEALRDSDYSEVTDVTDRLRIEGVIKEGEDSIPGGLAKGMTLNDIAEKHGVSVDVLVGEFKKGIQTEMEHTTDREMAKEITLDHLFEDPQYYTKLATVEEYVDDKGVEHVAAALPQTEEEPIKEEDYSETPEETLEGLKEMAMGNLERIADYANMISQRMGEGQNLESWMYSQLTIALENLNTVHDAMDGIDGVKESVDEGNGLWANIRAKKARGEKSSPKNSKAYKDAVKAGNKINNEETVNELTGNERQIKTGNPNNVFYVFYKGKFAAVYWAMNPTDLFNIYWDEFKVRRPAGSQFKLNSEFIIVPKKEYDDSTSNRYAKLKPYVDKFWDKLQNESVNENLDNYSKDAITDMIINLSRYEGNEKLIADLKKILKQRTLGKLKKEQSVNEATEPEIISQIKNIAKTHQNNIVVDPKSGKKMRVDAFSASAIATVYDALSDSSKEKFLASGLLGMQQMAMKLLKK